MEILSAASLDASKKPILNVSAHPEDILYFGGLAHAAADAGQEVMAIVATDGEASKTNFTKASDLGYTRRQESHTALLGLEIYSQKHLGLPDGELSDAHDYLARRIVAMVRVRNIGSIATFGPDGGDGHKDHIATYEAVMTAQTMLKEQGLHIPVLALSERGESDIVIPVPRDVRLAAAAIQRTQFASDGKRVFDPGVISARLGYPAEAYDIILPKDVDHQLPEYRLAA